MKAKVSSWQRDCKRTTGTKREFGKVRIMNGTIQEILLYNVCSPQSGIEGICTSIDPHEALNAYVIYIYTYLHMLSALYKKHVYIYIHRICMCE